MRFEIGKTYKFDREKYIKRNGIKHYKKYKELWIDDIEGVEFTVKNTFYDGCICYPNEFWFDFGVVSEWCVEVK
ncbi:TPA: hypothetical protein KON24_003691 [Clostridioides difficile]|nr:hypothetical protein [Clostridioides difficile]HBF4243824.1 hypothetical protein [Clostridioides difficile]HDO9659928.1 hypothetical protein [Clostridioides difficile]